MNTKLGIKLILSHRIFSRLSGMQFSYKEYSRIFTKTGEIERKLRKMGYTTQLLITLVYKTGTKLMLRQSCSTLVKYVNYLIVIFININENCRSKKICKKEKTEKRRDQLTSQNSFTRLFNILIT